MPDLPGLRPSGDRTRETLFNWLQGELHHAVVVDLFAGTGVLGLEALSRGAARVTLVERSDVACGLIRQSISDLQADNAELFRGDALDYLSAAPTQAVDLIFLDPPFGQGLQQGSLDLIAANDWLKTGGLIYVETPRLDVPLSLPRGWLVHRQKVIGEVNFQLLEKP